MFELNFPNPVTNAVDLFDRTFELHEVSRALASSARRPVIILGERKVGKTSLLKGIEAAAQTPHTLVCRLAEVYTQVELAVEILDRLWASAGRPLRTAPLRDADGKPQPITTGAFVALATTLVDDATRRIGDGAEVRFVWMLDDMDGLLRKAEGERGASRILVFLLHLVEQTALPFHFVFTMTHISPSLLGSYASSLVKTATLLPLRLWSSDEMDAFLDWLMPAPVVFTADAREVLFVASGGHPYFTKAVLFWLFQQLTAAGGWGSKRSELTVTAADVERAAAAAAASYEIDLTLGNLLVAGATTDAGAQLEARFSNRIGLIDRWLLNRVIR